jgi:hypothetical protein
MKKFYFLLLLIITNFAFSQVSFKPGIRAGANLSHFSNTNYNFGSAYYYGDGSFYSGNPTYDYKSKVDFYIGLLGNIRLTRFYALQPEINYSRQGSKVESNINDWNGQKLNVSYLGAQLINKFYFKDFNILVGPTLEFAVDNDFDLENEIDLGITAGIGYDITKNIGVEARVKKGFVSATYFGDYSTNVVFQAGLYYTFDMK